jgi:voltage-gated potassium channel
MSPGRRFLVAIVGIIFLIMIGTVGYILIEGFSPLDALYMTVITVSTVGFAEVKPLGPAGRLFTIFLIVTGVGTAFYLFATITELVVEGSLREFLERTAMHRKIHHLEGHVIICGFGRLGKVVAEELSQNSLPLVVIEIDPAKESELARMGMLYVLGSALDDDVLEQASIGTARAMVIATPSDADNVFITLSARQKNPVIRIHARGETEAGINHLKLAGADQAVSAYQWGAVRIASTIIRPSVVDFLELSIPGRGAEVDLEEIHVSPRSPLAGKAIAEVESERARLRIVALKRGTDQISIIPDPATRIQADDFLVVIGERAGLKSLVEIVET